VSFNGYPKVNCCIKAAHRHSILAFS
jgi:hypothetical protein